MTFRLILALIGTLTLPGCALFLHSPPTDLRLESVEIVEATSAWSSRNRLIRLGDHESSLPFTRGRFAEVKIEFSTDADLVAIQRRENHFISASIRFCGEDPDKYELGNGSQPYVFWAGGAVQKFTPDLESPEQRAEYEHQERKRFTIYVNVKRTDPYNIYYNHPPLPLYDLSGEPRDLCFQVAGWKIWFGAFLTNIVKVPKEAIANAFASPHL